MPGVLGIVLRAPALGAHRLPENLLQLVDLEDEPDLLLQPRVLHPIRLDRGRRPGEFRLALGGRLPEEGLVGRGHGKEEPDHTGGC